MGRLFYSPRGYYLWGMFVRSPPWPHSLVGSGGGVGSEKIEGRPGRLGGVGGGDVIGIAG